MDFIKFDIVGIALNPFVLMFVTVALGLLFGKIKFGKFSFGTSGAMFVGLAVGFVVYGFAQKLYNAGDETAAGFKAAAQIMEGNGGKVINSYFFTAALFFFVAAVGLLASKDLAIVLKKYGSEIRRPRPFDYFGRRGRNLCLHGNLQRHEFLCGCRRLHRRYDKLSGACFRS